MPSKSKSQQRFFGMVDAYKKGEMKNASKSIKKAAASMSMDDVKDFAETKHKGLPEKVEENIIRLTEADIHNIVKDTVKRMIKEGVPAGVNKFYFSPGTSLKPGEKDRNERSKTPISHRKTAKKPLGEGWNDDRFEYDHLSDTGNGGLEEYGMNIANLILGLGGDSDSLHGLGEEVAQHLLNSGDDTMAKERILKPFIEGLIAWYKNPGDPNTVYQQHGIERN